MSSQYHPFKDSLNPRQLDSCERCGRLKTASVHISLLERVEALRESYLDERVFVEQFVDELPNGWTERDDDPKLEGRQLIRVLIAHLAAFQCGKCDEAELRANVAATR